MWFSDSAGERPYLFLRRGVEGAPTHVGEEVSTLQGGVFPQPVDSSRSLWEVLGQVSPSGRNSSVRGLID